MKYLLTFFATFSGERRLSEARMLHRGFALLAALAISPAHAALIEYSYSFRSESYAAYTNFGIPQGDTITGGFLFDDTAPRTSHTESPNGGGIIGLPDGILSTSIYDVSSLLLWVDVGDHRLTARGDELTIVDAPFGDFRYSDLWRLTLRDDDDQTAGYLLLRSWSVGPLTNSELQVPTNINNEWASFGFDRWFQFSGDFGSLNGRLLSIEATPTSVPEPGTLSLLAAGVLGAFAARRRRHAAAVG